MAKTEDEVVLKAKVEGQETLDQLKARLEAIEANSKKTASSLNQIQGGVRNFAYQVQDLAVQLSMGTNAFMALGQQLPQLLSGFGTAGIVMGALAAVTIPLVKVGMEALGYDFRNLNDKINDLGKSTDAYMSAQRANMPTVDGLSIRFGALAGEAKKFYDIQDRSTKFRNLNELNTTVKGLQESFNTAALASEQLRNSTGNPIKDIGNLIFNPKSFTETFTDYAGLWKRKFGLDLTLEQATKISKELNSIDIKNPVQTAETLNRIALYLTESGIESGKVNKFWEESLDPIQKASAKLITMNENIRAVAEETSLLSTGFMELSNAFQPDIDAAKRNFDQITAIRKEGDKKVAEYNMQLGIKQMQDSADRSREFAAFKLKNEQEVNSKIADYQKTQEETFRAASLTNDSKKKQIDLEKQILNLSQEGKSSAVDTIQYNQQLLRNAFTYNEALTSIGEQRRKGLITTEQQAKLESEAASNRQASDELALKAMEARANAFVAVQQKSNEQDARRLELFNQTKNLSDDERKNAEQIFQINEERRKQLEGINQIQDPVERTSKAQELNTVFDQRIAILQQLQAAEENLKKSQNESLFSTKSRIDLENQLKDIEGQRAKLTMNEIEQKYYDIKAAADKSAKAAIEAEEARLKRPLSLEEQQKYYDIAHQGDSLLIKSQGELYKKSRTFEVGWTKAFNAYALEATNAALQAEKIFQGVTKGMEDMIVNFTKTGKLNWQDFLNSMTEMLLRSQIQTLMTNIFGSMGSGGNSNANQGGGSLLGGIGSLLGLAGGGIIPSNGPVLVGERGPELLYGASGSRVVPNAGVASNVTYNINAVDAMSFKQMLAQDPTFLYAVSEQGRRKLPGGR